MFKQLNSKAVAVVLAVVVVLHIELIYAEDNSGTLRGIVKSSSGTPVSGTFVKMKNPERRLTFMAVTQEQGRYTMNKLPAGRYTVQAIGGDYQSEPSAPVQSGRPVSRRLWICPEEDAETNLPVAWPWHTAW